MTDTLNLAQDDEQDKLDDYDDKMNEMKKTDK
jgi:hypothetical protein